MKNKIARFEGRMNVRSDREKEFTAWQARYQETVTSFPGLLAAELGAPGRGSAIWTTNLTFESDEFLVNWLNSPERAELLSEISPLTMSGMTTRFSGEKGAELGATEAFFTRVREDRITEFQEWQAQIHQEQAQFPGYLGMVFQPPVKGQEEWVTLVRFDNTEHLEAWLSSEQRKRLIGKLEELVEEIRQCRVTSSYPGWLPTAPAGSEPPPNWKVTMLVILGLFPIVMFQVRFFNPWLAANLPNSPGTLLANILSAILISYVTMPAGIYLFGWWLYPDKEKARSISIKGTVILIACYLAEMLLMWNL